MIRHAIPALLLSLAAAPSALFAQAVVQPLPGTTTADRLADQMRVLAASPNDLNALLTAGELSIKLDDLGAAASFFARAEKVDPRSGRAKAGQAAILVHAERPGEALRYFATAESDGLSAATFASDRGLAYDLIGEQERAQRDYRLALRTAADDETLRRYALSLGISGKHDLAEQQLQPLLKKQDRGAWRARAFIEAMTGNTAEATRIATTILPPGTAAGLQPFFERLAALGPIDRAFAVHFGEVRGTPQRLADARLAPPLAALGPDPYAPRVQVAAAAPAPVDKGRRKDKKGKQPVIVAAATAEPPRVETPPAVRTTAPAPVVARSAPLTATPTRADQPAVTLAASPTPRAPIAAVPRAPIVAAAPALLPPAAERDVQVASVAPTAGARPFSAAPASAAPSLVAASSPPNPPASLSTAPPFAARPSPSITTSTAGAAAPGVITPVMTAAAPANTPPADLLPRTSALAAIATASPPAAVTPAAAARVEARPARPMPASAPPRPSPPRSDELAAIVAGLPIPASELGVAGPRRPEPSPAAAPIPAVEDHAAAERAAAERAAADRAAAAKALADKKAADRKAAADKKALAEKKAAAEQRAEEAREAAAQKKLERANPERIWVQVAGGAYEGDLPKAWAAAKKKGGDVFAGHSTGYTTPLRFTNRVLAGPFKTDEEARAFVNKLKAKGLSGFTFTSDAGQVVKKLDDE